MPLVTNRFSLTGGVTMPIFMLTTMTQPSWVAMGKIGTRISNDASGLHEFSRNQQYDVDYKQEHPWCHARDNDVFRNGLWDAFSHQYVCKQQGIGGCFIPFCK